MENASKALIIAASVLITLLLIAFGMRIFNSTDTNTDEIETTLNTQEIATFNNKFTKYVGKKNKATTISLVNEAIASNATNKNHTVTINEGDPKDVINSITAVNYNISIVTYDANGYITDIKIESVTS